MENKMTLPELKALAYDLIARLQSIQAQLTKVNQAITEEVKATQPASVIATPVANHEPVNTSPTTNTF